MEGVEDDLVLNSKYVYDGEDRNQEYVSDKEVDRIEAEEEEEEEENDEEEDESDQEEE